LGKSQSFRAIKAETIWTEKSANVKFLALKKGGGGKRRNPKPRNQGPWNPYRYSTQNPGKLPYDEKGKKKKGHRTATKQTLP